MGWSSAGVSSATCICGGLWEKTVDAGREERRSDLVGVPPGDPLLIIGEGVFGVSTPDGGGDSNEKGVEESRLRWLGPWLLLLREGPKADMNEITARGKRSATIPARKKPMHAT